ncbi:MULTISPECIES: choice-of-anchor G family protein [unclassified Pseudoclavibacter]|uniref:choice-of-anchor G family protein n=1 Tax=unclassified Pseudoclavibacter TaxID=2615177 RepID=UPI001BA96D85|nr:choice-of-anchor G family protein [Pseudoclavibacter sp. Marseille-Q4354]MBS3177250.1 choice-of-anchor G family protein [Pseudoclavibacter sp. Marseille-Q4354]
MDDIKPASKPSEVSRRAVVRGAAWSAPIIITAAAAPAWAASCLPDSTLFNASAQGRLLSGTLGGTNLDAVASLNGAVANATASSQPAVEVSNPLSVSALSAITVNLGGVATALSSILTIPTNVPVGIINQYARAVNDGTSTGASGAIANNGTIQLDTSSGVPQLATLDLRTILQNATGSPELTALLSNVTALNAQIGAVAGRSFIDAQCRLAGVPTVATREYLLGSLRVAAVSPVVGALLSSLGSLSINTTTLLTALQGIPIVGPLLAGVGPALVSASVTANTGALTNASIPSSGNNPVTINFGAGSVVVDLAALLGGAYTGAQSPFLNNRAPNTRLFVEAGLPANALGNAIGTLADGLLAALLNVITVNINVAGIVTATGTLNNLSIGVVGIPVLLPGTVAAIRQAITTAVRDAIVTALGSTNVLLQNLFSVLTNVLNFTINAQTSGSGVFDVAALRINVLSAANLLDVRLGRGITGPNSPR